MMQIQWCSRIEFMQVVYMVYSTLYNNFSVLELSHNISLIIFSLELMWWKSLGLWATVSLCDSFIEWEYGCRAEKTLQD